VHHPPVEIDQRGRDVREDADGLGHFQRTADLPQELA